MESRWKNITLKEFCNINMGQSPKSETYNNEGRGIPFYQGRKNFGLRKPTVSTYCTDPKKIANKDEILLSVRAPVGDINIANEKCCIGRGIAALSTMDGDNLFLYYVLKANKKYWDNVSSGTVFTAVNKKEIENFKIKVPVCKKEIEKITAILSCLDDKIEINNEMNKTLEEVAQAIFKAWFIDFEPFKDGEFEESELGLIPKGWHVAKIGDICDVKGGKRLPKGCNLLDCETEYPYIRVTDVTNGYINKEQIKFIDQDTRSKISRYIIRYDDVYISIAGTIGVVGTIYKDLDCASLTENMARIIVNDNCMCRNYLRLYLQSVEGQNRIKSRTVGSTQPKLPLYGIKDIPILVSNDKIISDFAKIVDPIIKKVEENLDQISYLKSIRDTLLPKLISGEIKIN